MVLACPNTRYITAAARGDYSPHLLADHQSPPPNQTALGGTLQELFCKEDFPKLSKRLNANGGHSIQTFDPLNQDNAWQYLLFTIQPMKTRTLGHVTYSFD